MVGLDYLSLDRAADTLSGGEGRRIRLASQIGAGLVGVMYILDEPSIGLHPRDNRRLLDSLVRLRDLGNTVIVVEHDEGAIREADCIIDMGPGPGVHGRRGGGPGNGGSDHGRTGVDHGSIPLGSASRLGAASAPRTGRLESGSRGRRRTTSDR